MLRTKSERKFAIFFENERSQVRTLRVSFWKIARILAALGVFDLGWYWLTNTNLIYYLDYTLLRKVCQYRGTPRE